MLIFYLVLLIAHINLMTKRLRLVECVGYLQTRDESCTNFEQFNVIESWTFYTSLELCSIYLIEYKLFAELLTIMSSIMYFTTIKTWLDFTFIIIRRYIIPIIIVLFAVNFGYYGLNCLYSSSMTVPMDLTNLFKMILSFVSADSVRLQYLTIIGDLFMV